MLAQLGQWIRQVLRVAAAALRVILHLGWTAVRPPLLGALQVLAALVVLFEEWGWKPLSDALGWLARFRLIAHLELMIARLPPYGALVVFVLPTALLFPLKLMAVWLLAQGHVGSATALFLGAKVVATALVARLFMLTKPALMRMIWFARAYHWFMPWKEALFAQIRASWVWRYGRMVKTRVRLEAKQAYARWKPILMRWKADLFLRVRVLAAQARRWGRGLWNTLFVPRS